MVTNDRTAYYAELPAHHVEPLWRATDLMRRAPTRQAVPHLWRYAEIAPLLHRAGDLISTEEAERRVLMLINPGLGGAAAATANLYAGLQLVRPGEVAPKHRHAAAAIRLVVEGGGASTTVDGERTVMHRGDLVLTPNWAWHDHGNDGDQPVVWLDGLDIPLVNALDVPFFEVSGEQRQTREVPDDLSARTWAAGRLNPGWAAWEKRYSPVVSYPYVQTERILRAAADQAGSPYDGVLFRFTNPVDGGPPLPTIGASAQLLTAGRRTDAHRHTSAAVYHVLAGTGRSIVDGVTLEWGPRDTFAVPGWATHEHEAESEAILFSFTDEPVLRALDLYREEAV